MMLMHFHIWDHWKYSNILWRELCNAANDGESEKVENQKSEGNQYFHISPGAVIIWSKDSGILKGVKYELKNFFLLQILGENSSNFKKIKMELEIHNWYKGD